MLDGILLLCCAIPITAAGVIAMVNTDLIPAAPDGTVNTLSQVLGWDFGEPNIHLIWQWWLCPPHTLWCGPDILWA